MNASQPRQPSGTPTGGQWSETGGVDAGVDLATDVEPEPEPFRPSLSFPSIYLAEAQKRIEKANRRLAREGFTERFTYEVSDPFYVKKDENDLYPTEMVRLTLDRPVIGQEGFTFVASVEIDPESGQTMVRSAPGQDMGGWSPEKEDARKCDHCGKFRARAKVYLVAGPDGQVKQVGSNCMQAYLGIKPEGLWAIGLDPVSGGDDDGWYGGLGGTPEFAETTEYTIAMALAASDGGRGYKSRQSNETPTSMTVSKALFPRTSEEREMRDALAVKADEYLRDGTVAKVIERVKEMGQDSDYGRNMNILIGNEYTTGKNLGYVASAVSVYARAENKRVERETRPKVAKGYIAEPKAKVENIKAKALMFRQFPGYAYNSPPSTLVKFQTEDGHIGTWFTSTALDDLDVGDDFVIERGTVKDHKVYQDQDETQMTRVKWSKIAPEATADSPST